MEAVISFRLRDPSKKPIYIHTQKRIIYMKSKILILIAICGVVTLSFTFTSLKKSEDKVIPQTSSTESKTSGGFASEDKF